MLYAIKFLLKNELDICVLFNCFLMENQVKQLQHLLLTAPYWNMTVIFSVIQKFNIRFFIWNKVNRIQHLLITFNWHNTFIFVDLELSYITILWFKFWCEENDTKHQSIFALIFNLEWLFFFWHPLHSPKFTECNFLVLF